MKYFYATLIYLSILNSGYAQPVVTSDWFYSIGDTISTAFFYPESLTEPNGGIDLTWDISDNLTSNGESSLLWIDPAELNYFDEFPTATLGQRRSMEREYYYNVEGGQLQEIGYRTPNRKRIYEGGYPTLAFDNFAFGDTITTTYTYHSINFQNTDTTAFERVEEFVYAGFGTVITPEDTYGNCVMTKLTSTTVGGTAFIEYRFHKDNLANTIASYRIYTSGNVEPARAVHYKKSPLPTSVEALHLEGLEITGPFDQLINIASKEEMDLRLQIVDVAGRVIADQSKKIYVGSNQIDVHELKVAEVYILLLTDINSGAFQSFKFYK